MSSRGNGGSDIVHLTPEPRDQDSYGSLDCGRVPASVQRVALSGWRYDSSDPSSNVGTARPNVQYLTISQSAVARVFLRRQFPNVRFLHLSSISSWHEEQDAFWPEIHHLSSHPKPLASAGICRTHVLELTGQMSCEAVELDAIRNASPAVAIFTFDVLPNPRLSGSSLPDFWNEVVLIAPRLKSLELALSGRGVSPPSPADLAFWMTSLPTILGQTSIVCVQVCFDPSTFGQSLETAGNNGQLSVRNAALQGLGPVFAGAMRNLQYFSIAEGPIVETQGDPEKYDQSYEKVLWWKVSGDVGARTLEAITTDEGERVRISLRSPP